MNQAHHMRYHICASVFLILITLAVYWQVRHHEFVNYDDNEYVTENHIVRKGFTIDSVLWAFTTGRNANWNPVTWLSHMLDYQLYGLNPGGHHVTNVIIHLVNTLLLFVIFRYMTGKFWKSFFVAAFFAVHPLAVDSVAWIAERKGVLSAFFFILTLGAYAFYCKHPGMKRYITVIIFFALGLMAKPILVTLPFVLLLSDYWPLKRFSSGQSVTVFDSYLRKSVKGTNKGFVILPFVIEKIPLFLLSIASSVVTFIVQREGGAVKSFDIYPLSIRMDNALVSYMRYIGKIFWPHNLAVYYPHPGESLPVWQIVGAAIVLLTVTGFMVWKVRQYPYLFVGWFWYLGILIPVIGLVQVGSHAMADRYTYIPIIGILIMIVWGIPDIIKKRRHRDNVLAFITGVLLLASAVQSWFQVRCWHDSGSLFEHALQVTSGNYVAYTSLGSFFAERGRLTEAIPQFTEAIRIKPTYYLAHNNLGAALIRQGNLDEGIIHLTEALKINPHISIAHNNLGAAYAARGELDKAVEHYQEVLQREPGMAKAHIDLGRVMLLRGDIEEAESHFQAALSSNPGYLKVRYYLGIIYQQQGNIDDAITQYRAEIRINPDDVDALNNLAWIQATHENAKYRDAAKAVELAEMACKLTGNKKSDILDTLAAAYAEAGQFDDALNTAHNALKIAESSEQQNLTEEIKKRILLYQKKLPYHGAL